MRMDKPEPFKITVDHPDLYQTLNVLRRIKTIRNY